MVNALKKVDKKILIIAGCIILLPIIVIIILAIVQGCSNSKITPEKYEEKMILAAEKYIKNKDKEPKKEGEIFTVKLSKLIDGEYIKSTEDLLEDDSCKGSVTVRKNGSTIEDNKGGFLNYTVNLECKNYKTNSLMKALMNDIVTEGSGLYQKDNEYIFKGDEVNNYITFFNKLYRIVSIDESGIVKLLRAESESIDRYWDIKYNIDTESSSGKNIYKDSDILKILLELYNDPKKISESAKEHIISKDVCIGARDINNLSINDTSECSSLLENQVVSLLNVGDFASASLDADCKDITSKSCRNYNYMKNLFLDSWTMTAVSNNTYEVYYIYNGVVKYQPANKYSSYSVVIYIDGDEIIESGNGSEKDPYVIK